MNFWVFTAEMVVLRRYSQEGTALASAVVGEDLTY
jgi:hypothetical protein